MGGTEPVVDPAVGLARARAVTLMMLALPGSAYLYQGEELGLPEVADLPADALADPVWFRTGGRLKGRDGCRVPLPWTTEAPSHGFSTAPGWLPQPPAFAALSMQAQDGVEGSTLEFYRHALRLRRGLPELASADFAWSEAPDGVLAFTRGAEFTCVVNVGGGPVDLDLFEGDVILESGSGVGRTLPVDHTVWLAGPGQACPSGEGSS